MEEILKKIEEILKRQELLEDSVKELEVIFYEELITNFNSLKNINQFEVWYSKFNNENHKKIIEQIIGDISFIADANLKYFVSLGLGKEKALAVVSQLKTALGISDSGQLKKGGYLRSVLDDTSIKRVVSDYLHTQTRSKRITKESRKALKEIIVGNDGQMGIWRSKYALTDRVGSTIFDTYQRVDRIVGKEFADELGMQSAIYTGGTILGSRDFCKERNSKIYLISEIKSWKNLSFSGKNKGYDPLIHLGGHRCRHFWGWLINQTAIRLDPTLKEDENGNLFRTTNP